MKGSRDFDVNQFVDDGARMNNETAISDNAEQTEQSEQSVQTGRPERARFTDKTASVVPSEQVAQIRPAENAEQTVSSKQTMQTPHTVSIQSVEQEQRTEQAQSAQPTQSRVSSRQRKASLDDYRDTFLTAPKITDRQPVFVSREVRDRIDQIVRRLGERKMSVSGFLENLARHHLELYADDLEQWKRL